MKTVSVGSVAAIVSVLAFVGAAASFISHDLGKQSQAAVDGTMADEVSREARETMLTQADRAFIRGVCLGREKCSFELTHRHQYGNPITYRVTEEGVIIKVGFGVAEHLPSKCVGIDTDEFGERSLGTCQVTPEVVVVANGS